MPKLMHLALSSLKAILDTPKLSNGLNYFSDFGNA